MPLVAILYYIMARLHFKLLECFCAELTLDRAVLVRPLPKSVRSIAKEDKRRREFSLIAQVYTILANCPVCKQASTYSPVRQQQKLELHVL